MSAADDCRQTVGDFLRWWSDPASNPTFQERFARPVVYQRDVGLNDEGAVWLIQQSLGHEEVTVVADDYAEGRATVELTCLDPTTGLRHQVEFEFSVEGQKVVSVFERSRILGNNPPPRQ